MFSVPPVGAGRRGSPVAVRCRGHPLPPAVPLSAALWAFGASVPGVPGDWAVLSGSWCSCHFPWSLVSAAHSCTSVVLLVCFLYSSTSSLQRLNSPCRFGTKEAPGPRPPPEPVAHGCG